ncbi:MAG: asparagine synthase C-terminal domain-containing protein [Methanocorpusculum sp.]|nr:asparagine synthase C-terminal domain-containing protein [Methanocorpusculum sp.]
MIFKGWIEKCGHILSGSEVKELTPETLTDCGGEFYIETEDFRARDKYGIIQGNVAPATIQTASGILKINPIVPDLSLEEAIIEAVSLRKNTDAVVSLSGGVDSSLVAVLSGLKAICVGTEHSHDLLEAEKLSDKLGIDLSIHLITQEEAAEAFLKVISVLPAVTPINAEIALTGYFAARLANSLGAKRILTGQAADELFAGYARYSSAENLRAELDKDFEGLYAQRERDSAAAALFDIVYSMPYMDERVVKASKKLAPSELVSGDQRKIALRKTAEKYLPADTAWKPKKAMQYGSGISKILERIAHENGVKNTAGLIEKYYTKREQ